MDIFILGFLLFILVLLEGTVTTLPLVFVFLLCALIVKRRRMVFYAAFIAGLFLDLFTVRTIGSEIIFFLLFFYLVLLYQKKYEINSYPFVMVSSFVGSYLFLLIFGYGIQLGKAFISCIFAVIIFAGLSLKFKVQNYN